MPYYWVLQVDTPYFAKTTRTHSVMSSQQKTLDKRTANEPVPRSLCLCPQIKQQSKAWPHNTRAVSINYTARSAFPYFFQSPTISSDKYVYSDPSHFFPKQIYLYNGRDQKAPSSHTNQEASFLISFYGNTFIAIMKFFLRRTLVKYVLNKIWSGQWLTAICFS